MKHWWLLLLVALTGCAPGPVSILTPYGSRTSYLGAPYPLWLSEGRGWHRGVDIGAHMTGAPVLAAADGLVLAAREPLDPGCGNGIVILHEAFARRTFYCHLAKISDTVKELMLVKRGEVIGYIGGTGAAGPTPHLHFAVRRPDGETEDPVDLIVGCFEPNKAYPGGDGHPVLTWPIRC